MANEFEQICARDALYQTPPDWKADADIFHFCADVHPKEHSGWDGWAQIARDRRALIALVRDRDAVVERMREALQDLDDESRLGCLFSSSEFRPYECKCSGCNARAALHPKEQS